MAGSFWKVRWSFLVYNPESLYPTFPTCKIFNGAKFFLLFFRIRKFFPCQIFVLFFRTRKFSPTPDFFSYFSDLENFLQPQFFTTTFLFQNFHNSSLHPTVQSILQLAAFHGHHLTIAYRFQKCSRICNISRGLVSEHFSKELANRKMDASG